MKIAKLIDTCTECPNCKRYIDDTANHGSVLICTKSERLILLNRVSNHQHPVNPVDIPKWCELDDYENSNSKN
nr:MAG TPA: Sgf11 (transcriptional regulation protein) [Caudoviricetes sp.]